MKQSEILCAVLELLRSERGDYFTAHEVWEALRPCLNVSRGAIRCALGRLRRKKQIGRVCVWQKRWFVNCGRRTRRYGVARAGG